MKSTAEQIIAIIHAHKAECQVAADSYADLAGSHMRYIPQQTIARKRVRLAAEIERLDLILQEIGEPVETQSPDSRITQDCLSRLCTVGIRK